MWRIGSTARFYIDGGGMHFTKKSWLKAWTAEVYKEGEAGSTSLKENSAGGMNGEL